MENEIQVSKVPAELIAMALNKQADPNVLSKLMDLQERWEAQNARKAYVLAMTAFKQEAPAVLKKNDRVDFETSRGRTTYNYANLGSIVQEMTALLGKHELSAAWETSQNDKGMIKVSCNITHSAGHRETVTLEGPPDISGNKNAIQAIGSAVTYLQRYTLLAALGLATTEDDDGRGGKGQPHIPEPQNKTGSEKPKDESTQPARTSDEFINEAQGKRFFAIAKSTKASNDQIKEWLLKEYSIEHSKDIPKDLYDEICTRVKDDLSEGGQGA